MEVNEISKSENQRKKKEKSVISEVFSDYCSSTSIHGIGYLGAEDKNIFEKIWWIIVFSLSLIACSFLIRQTWIKWQENPVVLTFFTEQLSVWDVPFPAVTICPLNKVEHSQYNYTKYFNNRDNITEEELKIFEDISLICGRPTFRRMMSGHYYTDEDVFKNIKDVAPSLEQTVYKNYFKRHTNDKLFSPQITSDGLCFTFNALGKDDMYTEEVRLRYEIIGHNKICTGWNIEDGYTNDDENAYPERTLDEGVVAGLIIISLSRKSSKDHACGEALTGFKIVIHNPAEAPKVSQQYILAPVNKQVAIAVNPKVIRTSKGLANIPSNVRKCYFVSEKKLRFFKVYTQRNCKTECFANITKEMCNCLTLDSPRDENTKICAISATDCISESRKQMMKFQIMENKGNISDEVKKTTSFQIFLKCNCLPSCASLNYEYQVSSTDYDVYEESLRGRKWIQAKKGDYEATCLKIFFQDSHFLALHRSELFGQTEFLADIGGLLGLFMGFSFLSLLEIVYFLTVRLWCKFYSKNKLTYTTKN